MSCPFVQVDRSRHVGCEIVNLTPPTLIPPPIALLAMTTAEPLNDNIRRIAVLVASVDTAVGRQLLLHLPTEIAKQVRRALQHLGPIDPGERQRILAEFHSTAAKQSASKASTLAPGVPAAPDARPAMPPGFSGASHTQAALPSSPLPQAATVQAGTQLPSELPGEGRASTSLGERVASVESSWKSMDAKTLARFIRGERATVIAVVLNQLAPQMGVAVMQSLPVELHRDVLHQLTNLQDIDDDAMAAIEEHLSERLQDYQREHHESLGARRVAALMAAAPEELKQTWAHLLNTPAHVHDNISLPKNDHIAPAVANGTSQPAPFAAPSLQTQPQALPVDVSSTSTQTSLASPQGSAAAEHDSTASHLRRAEASGDEGARILPFPGPSVSALSAVDRSLIQLEFESILQLPANELAQLLSAADTQSVLLALAGASPSFMKRFYSILTKADAKILAKRLAQIGPLKLRDIDDAQRKIADMAASMRTRFRRPQANPTTSSAAHVKSQRASAAA